MPYNSSENFCCKEREKWTLVEMKNVAKRKFKTARKNSIGRY